MKLKHPHLRVPTGTMLILLNWMSTSAPPLDPRTRKAVDYIRKLVYANVEFDDDDVRSIYNAKRVQD